MWSIRNEEVLEKEARKPDWKEFDQGTNQEFALDQEFDQEFDQGWQANRPWALPLAGPAPPCSCHCHCQVLTAPALLAPTDGAEQLGPAPAAGASGAGTGSVHCAIKAEALQMSSSNDYIFIPVSQKNTNSIPGRSPTT
ncbi:hypothetical protein QTO34_014331 [Cnephaeus nilssonii]|uniref:Uncharacterized protein n=1 Tax=Cnephaeus nilssonii TaxID=3371016 RepID=A0AA40I647_CNENI|nr:hypothetical protein QTO34_014331 [Eptesicus nilssonii]